MTGIDRSATRPGSVIAVTAALIAFAAGGAFSWRGLAIAALGVVILGVGLARSRHDAVTIGAAALFAGVLVAGIQGTPTPALLVGAVATMLAFDSAGTAIDLGAQLGRSAPTHRLELVHAGGTLFVGTVAATAGWSLFQLSVGARPLTAPVLLLVAALCLAVALAARTATR